MKILLDECLPRRLKNELSIMNVKPFLKAGLAGTKNGRLLSLAEQGGFQVFFTMDKGVQYQQNLAGRSISVLIIHALSNRLADVLPHVAACRQATKSIEPGQVITVGNPWSSQSTSDN